MISNENERDRFYDRKNFDKLLHEIEIPLDLWEKFTDEDEPVL